MQEAEVAAASKVCTGVETEGTLIDTIEDVASMADRIAEIVEIETIDQDTVHYTVVVEADSP